MWWGTHRGVSSRELLGRRDQKRVHPDEADWREIDVRPVGSGGAAGTSDVLGHERTPEDPRHPLRHDARNDIGWSASSEGNNQRDRPRRIGLRPRDARKSR